MNLLGIIGIIKLQYKGKTSNSVASSLQWKQLLGNT